MKRKKNSGQGLEVIKKETQNLEEMRKIKMLRKSDSLSASTGVHERLNAPEL